VSATAVRLLRSRFQYAPENRAGANKKEQVIVEGINGQKKDIEGKTNSHIESIASLQLTNWSK
jgi:hypothetical protein